MGAKPRPQCPPDIHERVSDAHRLLWSTRIVARQVELNSLRRDNEEHCIDRMADVGRVTVDLLDRALEILTDCIDHEPEPGS